jgi:membrane peptidoglycan carboxypeptidase
MMRLAQWIAIGFAALVAAYCVYLSARVIEERARVTDAVEAILQRSDPANGAISEQRIAMLLAVEDPTFWENDGIDLSTPGAGLTTISQGLGKRVFFDRFTPGLAKLELMALTRFALIDRVAKRDVLAAFLASAYFGDDEAGPVIGFAEGARRWFGKELSDLTDREFIALVAMLPAPNRLDPLRHSAANSARVARIERLLAGACEPSGLVDVELEGCA